jgi:hypothetical protein
MVAAGIVSVIMFAWLVTNVVASPEEEQPIEEDSKQNPDTPSAGIEIGEALTDMNVRKNRRNVGIYDATERNPIGMVQHVGDLQVAQAIRMRDGAKLDRDGMPNVARPVVIRS